jgi:hypothetical protein
MGLTEKKNNSVPLGIKIIAISMGISSLYGLIMTCVFLAQPYKSSIFMQSFSIWVVVAIMIVTAIFFGWTAVSLWLLQNWARRAIIGMSCIIFLNIVRGLIKYNTFPNPKSWWHFYLYPILFIYLFLPSVCRKFKARRLK